MLPPNNGAQRTTVELRNLRGIANAKPTCQRVNTAPPCERASSNMSSLPESTVLQRIDSANGRHRLYSNSKIVQADRFKGKYSPLDVENASRLENPQTDWIPLDISWSLPATTMYDDAPTWQSLPVTQAGADTLGELNSANKWDNSAKKESSCRQRCVNETALCRLGLDSRNTSARAGGRLRQARRLAVHAGVHCGRTLYAYS